MGNLDDIRSKIGRAKKHINDFRIATTEFNKTKPCNVVIERDPETGKLIYTVTKVDPIPPQLRIIAGDAIQNLRSALDYIVYALVYAHSGKRSTKVEFPISDCEPLTEKQQSRFAGKVEGMRQDAIEAIQRIKPYKGGDDTLWRLHRLNIIDKHRLLTAASLAVSLINPEFGTGLAPT